MTADYLTDDIKRYMQRLAPLRKVYEGDEALDVITKEVVRQAAEKSYNAGMGGEHSDGGASAMIDRLVNFLQGVSYGATRDHDNLSQEFGTIYDTILRENDPQYQEYLRLKKIYE